MARSPRSPASREAARWWRRRPIGASSRRTFRWMRSSSRPRRNTSTSGATAATSCGALYNHHANANSTWYAGAQRHARAAWGRRSKPPPDDIRQYWHEWLERDGYPFWSFWENVRTLVGDPPPAERHVRALRRPEARYAGADASHRGIPRHSHRRSALGHDLEYCSFDWMKQHATKSVPLGGAFWDAGARSSSIRGQTAAGRRRSRPRKWRSTRRWRCRSSARSARDGLRRVKALTDGKVQSSLKAARFSNTHRRFLRS